MTWMRKPAALALLLAGSAARADGYLESEFRLSTLVSLNWEVGVPGASLRDFVDTTARGFQFEARFGVARHLSLGLATSWNWFSRNAALQTVNAPGTTVSASVYQRMQLFTLHATGHWYLTDGPVQPYVGVGIGGAYDDAYRLVADLATASSGFSFAADPQLGFLITFSPGFALHVQARYQFTLSPRFADVTNARWVGLQIGLAAY